MEEQARIQRIDDRFESDYLNYGKKMNKFQNETIPIMKIYKWVAAPAAAANPSSASSAPADPVSIRNPPGGGASSAVLPATADHQILCGIYHGACKEFKVIQQANVAPQLGKYLHDIIPRDSRTIADKNKGLFFRKIIKLCNSYLDYLNMIGEAVTGDMNTIGTVLKSPCISRVFC